jgi:hypothetical protein
MSDIVPFGKYKGQPLEAMAADQQYVDWLLQQAWFRDKFTSLYTVIVNNFQEPTETPEHNRMQAKFLNHACCMRLARKVEAIREQSSGIELAIGPLHFVDMTIWNLKFEDKGADFSFDCYGPKKTKMDNLGRNYDDYSFILSYRVECKPTLSDDFPAVLRQVTYAKCNVLVIGEYTGKGATLEQVKAMFSYSGITVVLDDES